MKLEEYCYFDTKQEGSAASPEKMVYIQNVDEEGYLPEIY